MEKIIDKVTSITRIKVNKCDIQKILASILRTRNFWGVLDLSNLPFNVVVQAVKELEKNGLLKLSNSYISLTKKGMEFCQREKITPPESFTCPFCQGRGISTEKLKDLLERFKKIVKDRPEPIIQYDQGYVTEESTISRIALMADRGDIQGKDLIILGDDDLVSIAASLSTFPKRVVVLEVDQRLIDFINSVARSEGFEIETYHHDLKNKLPENLVSNFDTFLTDPPETIAGLEVFIGRGLTALKGAGSAGYFGLTLIESSLKKWQEFEKILVGNFKVAVTDIIRDFNTYLNWDYLLESIRNDLPPLKRKPKINWYRSSMFRIETLEDTSIIPNEDVSGKDLYVDREALIYTKERWRDVD